MTNVIDFNRKIDYKVIFNLPTDKVIKVHKTAKDNFDIELANGHGVAYISTNGKQTAQQRVQNVFPDCEIIETTEL